MFKLVVLSALLAVAAARPSYVESPLVYAAPAVTVHEPAYAKVGAVVKSVPTSVSHQSSSVVHSSAHVVEDILAPGVKTTHISSAAPVVHTAYAAAPAPLYQTYAAAPAPLYKTYAAAAPVYKTYAAAPYSLHTSPYTSYSAISPLAYTATGVW